MSGAGGVRETATSFTLAGGLIAQLVPGFFIGLGPAPHHDILRTVQYEGRPSLQNEVTTIALGSILDGWF